MQIGLYEKINFCVTKNRIAKCAKDYANAKIPLRPSRFFAHFAILFWQILSYIECKFDSMKKLISVLQKIGSQSAPRITQTQRFLCALRGSSRTLRYSFG